MSHTLSSVHRAMSNDSDLVRLISENIANAQTAGYQRKFGIQRMQFDSVQAKSVVDSTTALGAELHIASDATPGTLSETREPLDVALNGAGSLIVEGLNGEALVRGGRLHFDDSGFLVTQQGQRVMGVSGAISASGSAIDIAALKISADGTISMAGNVIGQLQIRPASDAADAQLPQVMQGFVETSNVDPVTEMLKLMEIVRHFEAAQKVARSYDDLLQQGIADLGKI